MKKLIILFMILVLTFSLSTVAAEEDPEEYINDYTYGGTAYFQRGTPPEGMFNPLYSEGVYDADIVDLVFEGLTAVNKYFEAKPALAIKWDVSDDFKKYTFYLDKNARFHDGEPVTAEDVKYTFKMFMHPDYTGVRGSRFMQIKGAEAYNKGEADDVSGIKIIDDHTITFKLKDVYAPFLPVTCSFGILPKHILSKHKPSELDSIDFNQHPIGSGPFKFVEYKTDEYTKFAAFKDYREGRPYLDNIIIRYVEDQAAVMMLEKGELDWAEVSPDNYNQIKNMDNITLHKQIRNGYGYFGFNLKWKDTPVKEKAVRKAMIYGINRKGFHEVVMNGLAINVNSPISQASWAFNKDVTQYNHNPEKAQEILRNAGWKKNDNGIFEKDGQTLSFTFTVSSGSAFIDQLVALTQDNLNSIGFDVKIEKLEFNTLRKKLNNHELDAWFMAWQLGADPDPYAMFHSEGDWNRTGYSNSEVDKLIEKGRSTLDKKERIDAYYEMQEIWNEELPYIPMYANIYVHAMNKRLRGFDPAPGAMNPFHDWGIIDEIWIPEDARK